MTDFGYANISDMVGLTFTSVAQVDDTLVFKTADGDVFTLAHEQSCCEYVYIESIVGDLGDLVDHRLELAEESTSEDIPPPGGADDVYNFPSSYTWTFYKFATIKGYVDVRWFGSSNGYYGEGVSIFRHKERSAQE